MGARISDGTFSRVASQLDSHVPCLPLEFEHIFSLLYLSPAAVAQSDARPIRDQEVADKIPAGVQQHSFVKIKLEIVSTVILYFPLIQEGQLSVSGGKMSRSTG